MSGLIAKESGGGFDPVSQGLHQAVCYAIYELGTHYDERFKKSTRKCLLIWELPDERIDIEKNGEQVNLPRVVSKRYTVSLGEKAILRKDLQTWRGRTFTPEELKGFDLRNVLGKSCQIQIIHNSTDGKVYANVSAILPLPKGVKPLNPENPVVFYAINDSRTSLPEETPDWIRTIIVSSEEWKALMPSPDDGDPGNTGDLVPDDDIPF